MRARVAQGDATSVDQVIELASDDSPAQVAALEAVFRCVGLALLARTYRESSSETGRRQIALIMLGTGLASLPLIVFILLPQILPGLPYVTIWPALLALAFIPASYLYAIFRHNLMKLDQRVSQTVVGFLLFLALVGLYLAVYWVIWLLTPVLPTAIAEPDVRAVVASVVLIGVPNEPGIAARIFARIARHKIVVDDITFSGRNGSARAPKLELRLRQQAVFQHVVVRW